MITKEQAMKLGEPFQSETLHYGECKKVIGPKGGTKYYIEQWRPNGQCKTWKTRPEEFQLPIKHGFYDYSYLTHRNAAEFHLASECPLRNED